MNTAEMFSGGLNVGRGAAGALTFVALAGTAFKSYVKVPSGEVGLRTRGERVKLDRRTGLPKMVDSGHHLSLPFTDSIEKISIQKKTTPLESITVDLSQQHVVNASVTWRVFKDPECVRRSRYETDSLTKTVSEICSDGLLKTIHRMEDEENIHNKEYLFGGMRLWSDRELLEYGVILSNLHLGGTALSLGEKLSANSSATNSRYIPGLIEAGVIQTNGNGHVADSVTGA